MKALISSFVDELDEGWPEAQLHREIASLVQATRYTPDQCLDALALELAYRFASNSLSHEDAMGKAAALFNAALVSSGVSPQLSAVYWALDEAEYGSEPDDPEDEDAPQKRARAQIEVILATTSRNDA